MNIYKDMNTIIEEHNITASPTPEELKQLLAEKEKECQELKEIIGMLLRGELEVSIAEEGVDND